MNVSAISVDDETVNLLLLEELARTAGFGLTSFSDPEEAATHAAKNPVDIAFVDYLMPRMDGISFIRHVRLHHPDVPIIMITALGERRDIKLQALEAGANDFLTKPVDAAEFRARTRNLLSLRQSQLLLKDRAAHLEQEVAKATRTIVDREFETLVVLGRAAEYKDQETAHHIDRVAHVAKLLALQRGLNRHQQELIFHAAPLHDVGKMGIPDSLLLKPGPLDEEEFRIVKTHAEIGHNILRHSRSAVLRAGAQIAITHHEKYDGSGYPHALAGKAIPLFGRMVAVADCFDAMVSRRPYKEPWPIERVVDILVAEKGKHFDPDLVDLLLGRLPEVRRLYDTLKDW